MHWYEHPTGAEFDEYAEGYSAGMDNPLKRLVGASAEQFVEVKVRWLLRDWAARAESFRRHRRRPALLDYGCGVGTMLALLADAGFEGSLTGCDISAGMLHEAEERWAAGAPPSFCLQEGAHAPFPDRSFDLIVVSAVLHHVPPADRPNVYREVLRLLRPDGRAYFFEHNPFNPITQWVVKHTPIDHNAQLLPARELVRSLRALGCTRTRTRYLMFFPPAWKWLRRVEDRLSWVPLGGQYVVRLDAAEAFCVSPSEARDLAPLPRNARDLLPQPLFQP